MAEFVRVAATDEIPVGSMKAFEMGHNRFLVAHTEEGFFAVVDECTHDSALISNGELRGCEVVCSRHGARFDLRTGEVTSPPAVVPIDTLKVKIDDNDVLVFLED